jgi:hypothetical protein
MVRTDRMIRALLLTGLAGIARVVLAADLATHAIHIPAQDLGSALLEFAAATHQQIAFDPQQVRGYRSTALSGTYAVEDGLQTLTGSAPFLIRTTPSGVLTVAAAPAVSSEPVRAAAQRSAPPPAHSTAAAGSAGEPQAPPQVTIEARRTQLEPRISVFVNKITEPYDESAGLARWLERICPLVSGPDLPRREGDFIRERISELARAAGVPLASEKCTVPNLYVLVTNQPAELLKGMNQRNRWFTFADAPRPLIREFIETPRAVRVWYQITLKTPEGLPLAGLSFPYDIKATHVFFHGTNVWSQDTHLSFNIILDIYRVFVIVDQSRLQGVSRGQLADYVAMISLAQLRADPRLADAPSILKLFEGDPQSAPRGASDWDAAFLKALYVTEQKSRLQQTLIAREMVR